MEGADSAADGARLRISGRLSVAADSISEAFVTASGPGGQNVNKVATAVQLRFALNDAGLPPRVARRAAELAGNALTKGGEILIRAETHRTREANRREARERLLALLQKAAAPQKRRRPTRPSLSAKRKRTDRKVQRGRTKAARQRPALSD